MAEYLDEFHQYIAEFADNVLDEEERADFVDQLLERHGYEKVSNWAPPSKDGKQKSSGGLLKPRSTSKKSSSYFKK